MSIFRRAGQRRKSLFLFFTLLGVCHAVTMSGAERKMDAEDFHFPLHLGVTEAGCDEDGRIKSAVGIGSFLAVGIGDTIRVSLSEPPEAEIPVTFKILQTTRSRITQRDRKNVV